jgi:hypothetical protein
LDIKTYGRFGMIVLSILIATGFFVAFMRLSSFTLMELFIYVVVLHVLGIVTLLVFGHNLFSFAALAVLVAAFLRFLGAAVRSS